MARFNIERWCCDRCGVETDRWLKPASAYEVRASVDYGTLGSSVIDWRELCVDCNNLVERLLSGMARDADLARRSGR